MTCSRVAAAACGSAPSAAAPAPAAADRGKVVKPDRVLALGAWAFVFVGLGQRSRDARLKHQPQSPISDQASERARQAIHAI